MCCHILSSLFTLKMKQDQNNDGRRVHTHRVLFDKLTKYKFILIHCYISCPSNHNGVWYIYDYFAWNGWFVVVFFINCIEVCHCLTFVCEKRTSAKTDDVFPQF